MKRIVVIGILCAAAMSVVQAEEIDFRMQPVWEDVMAAAAESHQPVMIDFYTDWCGWCKVLDQVTYAAPEVREIAEKFVCVKYNAEEEPGKQLSEKFGVSGFPTILFVNGDGEEIDRVVGFQPPEVFVVSLRKVVDGKETYLALKQKWAADSKDPDVGLSYFDALIEREETDAARAVLDAILGIGTLTPAQAFQIHVRGSFFNLGTEETEEARVHLDKALAVAEAKRDGGDLVEYAGAYLGYGQAAWAEDTVRKVLDNASDVAADVRFRAFLLGAKMDLGSESMGISSSGNRKRGEQRLREALGLNRSIEDGEVLNEVAWIAAESGIACLEALPAAERAVELSEGDPNILDTLAEVHFRLGNCEKAIELNEKALEKSEDPNFQAYLREQQERYRAEMEDDFD